jgi:8-oxo-dGTP diphosphatase
MEMESSRGRVDYVCGFAFNPDWTRVLLIQKKRGPADMAGKMNGIGGKIESGEGARSAMVREFREECGIHTEATDWSTFFGARFSASHTGGKPARVYFMCATLTNSQFFSSETTTDEAVSSIRLQDLSSYIRMKNLDFLIPMAEKWLKYPEDRWEST